MVMYDQAFQRKKNKLRLIKNKIKAQQMHQSNMQNEQENRNFNILLAAHFFLLVLICPQNGNKECMVFG